jgi:nicotinamide-nucleotide amidase
VRRALARVAGTRLVLNERMLAALEARHRRVDRPLPRRAERLALLPQSASVWIGQEGEAAWAVTSERAAWFVLERGHVTTELLQQHLVPFAMAHVGGIPVVMVRTLKTAGAAAGDLEERLVDWLGKDGDVAVSTLPADGEVWVRLRARGATVAEAAESLAEAQAAVTAALGDDCYGADAETLEDVVGRLLLERGLTLAVAESCTGGLIGHRITSVAGSSRYFERGVMVYSNEAKQALLGVPRSSCASTALSAPRARRPWRGASRNARARRAGLSVTGIAGPGGGSEAKPVGTVFIGLAVNGTVTSRRFRFLGDRASVKWQSSQMALDMLRTRTPREGDTMSSVAVVVAVIIAAAVLGGCATARDPFERGMALYQQGVPAAELAFTEAIDNSPPSARRIREPRGRSRSCGRHRGCDRRLHAGDPDRSR